MKNKIGIGSAETKDFFLQKGVAPHNFFLKESDALKAVQPGDEIITLSKSELFDSLKDELSLTVRKYSDVPDGLTWEQATAAEFYENEIAAGLPYTKTQIAKYLDLDEEDDAVKKCFGDVANKSFTKSSPNPVAYTFYTNREISR